MKTCSKCGQLTVDSEDLCGCKLSDVINLDKMVADEIERLNDTSHQFEVTGTLSRSKHDNAWLYKVGDSCVICLIEDDAKDIIKAALEGKAVLYNS